MLFVCSPYSVQAAYLAIRPLSLLHISTSLLAIQFLPLLVFSIIAPSLILVVYLLLFSVSAGLQKSRLKKARSGNRPLYPNLEGTTPQPTSVVLVIGRRPSDSRRRHLVSIAVIFRIGRSIWA